MDGDVVLHLLAAATLGVVVVVLRVMRVKTVIGFTIGFALVWPIREIFQHGTDIFTLHRVLEWVPPAVLMFVADLFGRWLSGRD